MKKLFITLCAATVLVGCTSEPELRLPEQESPDDGMEVTLTPAQVAARAAESTASRLYPSATSRAGRMRADMNRINTIVRPGSRAGETDTMMYVVNFENEGGYAIVSGHDANDVLSVVDHGSFDPEKSTENKGLEYFLACAENYVAQSYIDIDNDLLPDSFKTGPWIRYPKPYTVIDTLSHSHVDTRLGALCWGKTGIYGAYCTNGSSGCAATAIGAMIAYFRFAASKNETLTYTFPERDIDKEFVDWKQILSHKKVRHYDPNTKKWEEHICYAKDPEASHITLGRILRQLGQDGHATYQPNGETNMSDTDALAVIKKYLPDYIVSNILGFKANGIHSQIYRGFIYLIGTIEKDGNAYTYHWLGSGFDLLKTQVKTYEYDFLEGGYVLREDKPVNYFYTYMNWGCDGIDDGFYKDEVFNAPQLGHVTTTKYIGIKMDLDK